MWPFQTTKEEGNGVDFKYNLGDVVKCKITGFSGVVVARTQWLTNCNTYGVKPRALKDGMPQENVYIDEPSIEVLEEKTIEPQRSTGGPERVIRQTNR